MKGLTLRQRIQLRIVRAVNRLYQERIRPRLFEATKANAEIAHEWAIKRLRLVSRSAFLRLCISLVGVVRDKRLSQNVCGLQFDTPVGLAAGFDKHGVVFPALAALGFGAVELGGFTRHGQPGKDQPRVFRLPEDRAIINRMGFNNPGARAGADNIRAAPKVHVPVGINLGKSLVTAFADAASDYSDSVGVLYDCGDYFVVNVSSPNTPELRLLQDKRYLGALLRAVRDAARRKAAKLGIGPKPTFVKISPDCSWAEIDDIIVVCWECGIDGIIVLNTTISREGIVTDINEEGGLSGPPLKKRALEVVRYIHERISGRCVIIGVGGISSGRDAYEMLKAGADLVQLYTAFVYKGPFIAAEINLELLRIMAEENISHISELRCLA